MEPLDETTALKLAFDNNGLIPAIAQDAITKDILMMAWMNEEALKKTIETGEAHYWSRSRQELWHKGATSGGIQFVREIRVDCDQDVLLLMVDTKKGACHTGRKTCFYRIIDKGTHGSTLIFDEKNTAF